VEWVFDHSMSCSSFRTVLLPLFDRTSRKQAMLERFSVLFGPSIPARHHVSGSQLRRAFELAGGEFIDENGGGPGVRLRKPVGGKSRKGKED
jgi:hypothetical protein